MWYLIAAIAGVILGFGAGSAGLAKFLPPVTPSLPPSERQTLQACYQPDPGTRLTLRWPNNFTNVSNTRRELNSRYFGSEAPTFNTAGDCQNLVMSGRSERNFILVRKDVRISSCKTDELAGPYGTGECKGWNNNAPALAHRGSCSLDGYTDLRKIADFPQEEKILEIFWNPFSYNVGCNYKQDENCGPGERRNINLKDFIYVLKKRDAFTPKDNPGCPALWDAGSANFDACSHFFDVYLAEDVYEKMQNVAATNDPEDPYYFLKQVVENCQEQTLFIPAPEADFGLPPSFLKTPFFPQNQPLSYTTEKIIPESSFERTNYLTYIWGQAQVINPFKTNLLKENEIVVDSPFPVCRDGSFTSSTLSQNLSPAAIAPLVNCFDPLGKIYLKEKEGKVVVPFKAYSKPATPQTFYLFKENDQTKAYVYFITNKDFPAASGRDPSLQLKIMPMIQRNQWTWATPWCKPAIYLYPEKPTDINVKLQVDGKLTVSNPKYEEKTGWQVRAYPDGTLKLIPNYQLPITNYQLSYPYLYYEAELKGVTLPQEGFVFAQEELPKELKSLMEKIGFNEKEISDFLAYWLPRLSEKPYYFVSLLPENIINEKEKLSFSTVPDTLIRVRFVFEGLAASMSVAPLTNIPQYHRHGFTVTDWGGTLVGRSCSEVIVK